MSAERANQEKLSLDEVADLKDQLRGEDGLPNTLGMRVCRQVAKSMADQIEAETGDRPKNEEEWKTTNTVTRGMALRRAMSLPNGEWPESPGFPAPEEYRAALQELNEQSMQEASGG